METAEDIACAYGATTEIRNLELAILRHMEHHMAKEREACARVVESLMGEDRSTLYDIGALQMLADRIRKRA